MRCKVPNPHTVVYPRAWVSPQLANGGPLSTKQDGLKKNFSESAVVFKVACQTI